MNTIKELSNGRVVVLDHALSVAAVECAIVNYAGHDRPSEPLTLFVGRELANYAREAIHTLQRKKLRPVEEHYLIPKIGLVVTNLPVNDWFLAGASGVVYSSVS